MVTMVQLLQLDLEVHRTACHHVLYFEIGELHGVAHILYRFHVQLGRLLTIDLTLGAGYHHFSILEYQCRCPSRLFQSHYQCGEALGIVLRISAMVSDLK